MSQQSQFKNSKYRNWVTGGLAYRYLKDGLVNFTDDVIQREHTRILGVVTNTSGNACVHCNLKTLQPYHEPKKDHTGRRCPWGLPNCNCLYPEKTRCPNNICDVIMEEILKSHGSTPLAPNWKNTDVQKWYTSPWEIAKCFINAPGYSNKTSAVDIDAFGLLTCFINNKNLHAHLSCNMTGKNIFIKCREIRNKIFHSPTMELEDAELKECIANIIKILEDPKELATRADAQQAVLKLKQLMLHDFNFTTQNEVAVSKDALAFLETKTDELEQTIQEAKDDNGRKDAGEARYTQRSIWQDKSVDDSQLVKTQKMEKLTYVEEKQDEKENIEVKVLRLEKELKETKNLLKLQEEHNEKVLQLLQEQEEKSKSLEEKKNHAPVIVEEGGLPLRDRRNIKAYRPPKDTCIFDGRLIKLVQDDVNELDAIICKTSIGNGRFGKVYKSDGVSNGFGIKVAVKKISFDETDTDKTASIRREMISSRILHPFILPLLADVKVEYHDKRTSEYWMVSPFFEKGDLLRAIKNKDIPTGKDKVKILLQLAKAIQYLHTKVPNVREVILHKDISSKNVVLDGAYNARLIDFGLAREKNDQTTKASGTLAYCHPDLGKGEGATESWDYFSFGVIVREMLTGLGPDGCNNTFLYYMKSDEVLKKSKENGVCFTKESASELNGIADQCLKCKDWTVHEENVVAKKEECTVKEFKTNVVETIENIWKGFNQSNLLDVQDSNCHLCMINPKAKTTSMTQKHAANCQQKIETCIACEKYSFLNPITCYCGTKLTPLGGRCGALLIAGNDEDKMLAEALTKDVTDLKKVLTSKAPCIIGISENNVRMVTPYSHDNTSSNQQNELWPKVKENVKYLQEQPEIDTLLIYFSGHGGLGKGSGDTGSSSFKLGSVSENISHAVFEELLNTLDNIDKLIIILDCCNAPKIKFKKDDRKVIQINACKAVEPAHMTEKGSHFTKTLIQGLKGMAERRGCNADCQSCKEYFLDCNDFVTVSSLHKYLHKHMKYNKGNDPTVTLNLHGDSSNIAYFTDEEVQIVFSDREDHTQQVVHLEDLRNMEQLQHKLCKAYGKETNCKVKVQKNTYRKDNQYENCDTIEKVMAAWVQRQPLTVKFESI